MCMWRWSVVGLGWSEFVAAEKFVAGDSCCFMLEAPHSTRVLVFDRAGNPLLMADRPEDWDLDVAQAPLGHFVLPQGPWVHNFAVPESLFGLEIITAIGVALNGPVMERIMDVWINYDIEYPIYVARMLTAHVGGAFYLNASMSAHLGFVNADVELFYGASQLSACAR